MLRYVAVRTFAYGRAAAILTSVRLVVGFNEASSTTRDLIGALLIVAIADNLTDSLSIHIYQESEHLQPRSRRRSELEFGVWGPSPPAPRVEARQHVTCPGRC